MAEDAVDYEEIVDGRVDEVKQQVKDEDVDLERVLEAEQDGENRVTLTDWLEERIAENTDEADEAAADTGMETVSSPDQMRSTAYRHQRHAVFGAGLVTGIVLVALIVAAGVFPAAGQNMTVDAGSDQEVIPPNAAEDRLATYIDDNKDVFLPPRIRDGASLTVQQVEQYENSSLYRVTLRFSMEQNGETRTQDIPGYMTRDGEYVLFGGQLFALDTPAANQVQQPAP